MTTLAIAGLALLSPAVVSAQAAFEGTVKGIMTAGGNEMQLVQHARNGMMRQDLVMSGGQGTFSTITDGQTGQTIMILHQQRMWMDLAVMSRMMPGMLGGGAPSAPQAPALDLPEIERTDRVETIAGHECRHYLVANASGAIDICAANGLGSFVPGAPPSMGMMGGGAPAMPALPQNAELWLRDFPDGFFILSMTSESAGGMSFQVLEVDRMPLQPELFEPPAGYREMKIPG
jgi:hypothetical protein